MCMCKIRYLCSYTDDVCVDFYAFFSTSMFRSLSRVQKEEEEAQRKQLEVMMKQQQKQLELIRQKAREVSQLQVRFPRPTL